MVRDDSASEDTDGTDRGVDRRTVLQGLGAGTVAGVGLVGTASGHEVQGKPVFCGCSQLCVCVDGSASVLMARETNDGEYDVGFVVGDDELDPYPTGKPRYSGNFCVSTDDEGVPDGKIIGLQVGSTRWVNPNQCAQKALEAEREQLASTHPRPEGDSGGPCGKPPCEHPGNGRGPGDGKRGNDRGRGNDDDDDDSDDAADDAGEIEATWEDCETVTVTGSDENLEGITVYYLLCFEPDGPCPDGTQGSVDDPELPLTIEDQYLTTEDVPYTIAVLEFHGDVEPDHVERPDDLDCSFE